MGLISILGKGIKAMIDEATTPESFKIGEKFETYVREYLFVGSYYEMLERTHDYKTNKDYVQSSLRPDFKFRDKYTKKEFHIEAKFRTGMYNNKIIWCNDNQLKRYLEYHKEQPVYLILGMGEKPDYPEFLALIPLLQAKYTGLFPSHVQKYEIDLDKPVSSKALWNR